MDDPNSVWVPVTCSCGNQFNVGLAGRDLNTVEIACNACGDSRLLTEEEIASLVQQHQAMKEAATDALSRATRGMKGVKFIPKR